MARTSRKQKKNPMEPCEVSVKIALYVRLSDKDNGGRGKDSISNQLELLRNFAKHIEGSEIRGIYKDNGYTGTNFERPEWERLMEDVRSHRINCIIVKDLSRFARNYLEAGEYLEKIFPCLAIRFIAVNDEYDSANQLFPEKDLTMELKNLMNDYYSRDISKKIMTTFKTKKAMGEFIGNKAPYGYRLEEHHFLIDESAAEIVRRIFSMKLKGISSYKIAEILNQEGVASPSRYAQEQGFKKYKNCSHILWQPQAVNRILHNQVYTGNLIQGKYVCSAYSRERPGLRPEKAWEIRENVHEPIIERTVFEQVQDIRKGKQSEKTVRQNKDIKQQSKTVR